MDTETAANPAGEADTHVVDTTAPADVATEATTQAEGTTDSTTPALDDLSDLLPAEDEYAEVDYEGAKYKVPAPLKDALLRQADYTRKTTEVAESRRALDADRQAVQQAQQLSAAEIRAFAQLDRLTADLSEFEGVNWAQLDHSDPDVQRAKGMRDELARELSTLQNNINGHLSIKAANAQREAAKEREATDAAMAREIKDWSPEKRNELEQLAVKHGVPAEYASQAGAAELRILNLANIGAKFIERQRAAASAKAQSEIKPAAEVGAGAGSGTSDPSAMSMDEYRAWRAKQ